MFFHDRFKYLSLLFNNLKCFLFVLGRKGRIARDIGKHDDGEFTFLGQGPARGTLHGQGLDSLSSFDSSLSRLGVWCAA